MPASRPTKIEYWLTEDGLQLLEHFKRNDLTDAQIAKEKIGIHPSTLSVWRSTHAEIDKALKKGLEFCIADAEEALVSKFKPFTYKEQTVETWEDVNPKTGKPETKTHKKITEKTVMPDTAAIIFFLKAKAGWRENTEVVDDTVIRKMAENFANVGTIK